MAKGQTIGACSNAIQNFYTLLLTEFWKASLSRKSSEVSQFLKVQLSFYKKVFGGHMSFGGGGALLPLFWISGDVSSGFQSISECNVHSQRSTSGATCANLFVVSSTAGHFPTCISRSGTWLRFKRAITRTEDERATIVPATQL